MPDWDLKPTEDNHDQVAAPDMTAAQVAAARERGLWQCGQCGANLSHLEQIDGRCIVCQGADDGA